MQEFFPPIHTVQPIRTANESVEVTPLAEQLPQVGQVVWVETKFGSGLSVSDPEVIRGFYTVHQDKGQWFLDPKSGEDLLLITLDRLRTLKPVENYQQEAREALRDSAGWKLHLNFDLNNPKAVSQIQHSLDVLKEHGLIKDYKIGRSSDQEDKAATIYIGEKRKAVAVTEALQRTQENLLKEPGNNILRDDMSFTTKVYGRFDAHGDQAFHQYGINGIPFLKGDASERWGSDKSAAVKEQRALKLLTERYGKFFTG